MPSASQTTSTRRVPPSWQHWNAHPYQAKAVDHLCRRGAAALFLDPGLGKTAITLSAFMCLQEHRIASKMLVIAPLRVCQTVWRQEAAKWEQFRHLRFSLLHGAKKAERLKDAADIWLINPEGVAWLAQEFSGRSLPWDTVVIDELTKFKNHSAERSKALRPRLKQVARRWGLTGSPAPNGLMDLFGQMLVLDDGAALGRFITHYRDTYFQLDYDGFTYTPMPGAQKRIETRIAPYVLTMSADDYLTLPPLIDDIRLLEMDATARKVYSRMKKDMLAELPEGVVTGANAAAVYSKLKQMGNGAVYIGPDKSVSVLHGTKLDALDDLVEELSGQQLLLAYEFQHDCDRLVAHYGERLVVLASGMSEAKTATIVNDWNAGKIKFLACHPASAAHGLNLQQSACAHVAWFSPPWDLELYMQFIRRVRRQGNDAQRIFNHIFVMRDSIDELALQALNDKDATQSRLLKSLNSILHDADTHAAGQAVTKESTMVAKLSRGSDAAPRALPAGWAQNGAAQTGNGHDGAQGAALQGATQVAAADPATRALPAGWGKPTVVQPVTQHDPGQAQRIEDKLRGNGISRPDSGQDAMVDARSAFGGAVQAAREALTGETQTASTATPAKHTTDATELPAASEAVKPFGKRTRKAAAETEVAGDAFNYVKEQLAAVIFVDQQRLKLEILKLAFAGPDTDIDDGMEIARTFLKFVNGDNAD